MMKFSASPAQMSIANVGGVETGVVMPGLVVCTPAGGCGR